MANPHLSRRPAGIGRACWAALALLTALALLACQDGGPDTEKAGAEGFREFAARLDDAARDGDASFLADRVHKESLICDIDPAATCAPGEEAGLPVGHWRSQGSIVPPAALAEEIDLFLSPVEGTDEWGDGTPRVYALNIGDGRYDAILTSLIERPPGFAGDGPLRAALSTSWTFSGTRWELTGLLEAAVLAEDLLEPTVEGREYYPHWELYRR